MSVASPAARAAGGSHVASGLVVVTPSHLFVYGTLRPGEVRWHHLAPYVTDDGVDATVPGAVYDTGLGYPAAVFVPAAGSGVVRGRVYGLVDDEGALAHLDEVEGAVRGLYRRVGVVTSTGVTAWAYECGDPDLLVRRIDSGDWADR